MRIDATIPTLLHIFKKGGLPVIMTHVGRPYDKKTGQFTISDDDSVVPIVKYLNQKLGLNGSACECAADGSNGITNLDPIRPAIKALKAGLTDFVYLPNTRWFNGEEAKDESADLLSQKLAAYGDVFINDAFGSWQPHVSTVGLAKLLPAYAGLLMQKEVQHLQDIFEPQRPLVSVVAGAKFDTKIGPLSSLIQISDFLILGGVLYNAYLCVKYGIKIKGVGADDLELAAKFLNDVAKFKGRIVEIPYIVESDSFDQVSPNSHRVHAVADLKAGTELNYVLDAAPQALADERVASILLSAHTIFINAVMGYTTLFKDGSMAMFQAIDQNKIARKLFGGGDTIQEFKDLLPGTFTKAINDEKYYFFTGGGAILDAIEKGSPYFMKPVQTLIQ